MMCSKLCFCTRGQALQWRPAEACCYPQRITFYVIVSRVNNEAAGGDCVTAWMCDRAGFGTSFQGVSWLAGMCQSTRTAASMRKKMEQQMAQMPQLRWSIRMNCQSRQISRLSWLRTISAMTLKPMSRLPAGQCQTGLMCLLCPFRQPGVSSYAAM